MSGSHLASEHAKVALDIRRDLTRVSHFFGRLTSGEVGAAFLLLQIPVELNTDSDNRCTCR